MRTRSSVASETFSRLPSGLSFGSDGAPCTLKARRRENGWSLMGVLPLLDFHFGKEHRGGSGGDGNLAALGAANAVEHVFLVTCGDDASESRERRADNIHAADEFIRPSIGIDFVHNHGKDLESL